MLMIDPELIARAAAVAQVAGDSGAGEICLPLVIVLGVPGAMAAVIGWQGRSIERIQKRMEDAFYDQIRAQRAAAATTADSERKAAGDG
ncbi:MAG: hypothetical protein ACSLE9_07945 [Burkholderiaceae bacterium]